MIFSWKEIQSFQEETMKIFQSIEKNFMSMGFIPTQSSSNRSSNVTILMGFGILAIASIFEIILLYRANTFEEYVESIFVTTATVMFVSIFTATTFKIPYFYRFINTYQNVIDASE